MYKLQNSNVKIENKFLTLRIFLQFIRIFKLYNTN